MTLSRKTAGPAGAGIRGGRGEHLPSSQLKYPVRESTVPKRVLEFVGCLFVRPGPGVVVRCVDVKEEEEEEG